MVCPLMPDANFSRLLEDVARWAMLDPVHLLSKQVELADAIQVGDRRKGVKVLSASCPARPWDWPAYTDLLLREFSERALSGDPPEPDRDEMIDCLFTKLVFRHAAILRHQQMEDQHEFRPYWQMRGPCLCAAPDVVSNDDTGQRVHLHDDPFWKQHSTPWNCDRFHCSCSVYSLSPREFEKLQQQPTP